MSNEKEKSLVMRVLALTGGQYTMDDGVTVCSDLFGWSAQEAQKWLASGRELAGRALTREEYDGQSQNARRAYFVGLLPKS